MPQHQSVFKERLNVAKLDKTRHAPSGSRLIRLAIHSDSDRKCWPMSVSICKAVASHRPSLLIYDFVEGGRRASSWRSTRTARTSNDIFLLSPHRRLTHFSDFLHRDLLKQIRVRDKPFSVARFACCIMGRWLLGLSLIGRSVQAFCCKNLSCSNSHDFLFLKQISSMQCPPFGFERLFIDFT